MSKKSRAKLQLETFESRITPAVTRTIGTLQIVDTTASPTFEWASGPADVTGTVIGTNNLSASIDVDYTLTGDQAKINKTTDYVVENEVVTWWNDNKGRAIYTKTVAVGIPAGSVYPYPAVIQWQGQTTNNAEANNAGTAKYLAVLKEPGLTPNQVTHRIILTNGASDTRPPGRPNNPLRPTSPKITTTDLGFLDSPDLPTMPAGGYYRLLTLTSATDTDFTFTAADSTGYGLFSASSPNLVQNDSGDWVLDTSTTLSPVFLDGSQTVGAYDSSDPDLVLRANTGGDPILLSGHAYSAMPTALSSVADGHSVAVAADDVQSGNGILWLVYGNGDEARVFVLVPTTSSDPQLTVSDVSVAEGNSGTTSATFTVSLSAASASTVTVNYGTVSGTATAGTDFTPTSGTLTFAPGETSKSVTVPVIGNTTFEPNKDFFLTLGSASNAVIADSVGQGTILNDDALPTAGITSVVQQPGAGGTTVLVFTVTLSNPSWQTINVDFATSDGTAIAGTNYDATSGTLTFLPGQTTQTITVTVHPDAGGGVDTWFDMGLSNPVNANCLISPTMGVISADVGVG
jgi:hypothetical protein